MELTRKTMSFEEVSMERSKSFITALQELKNLRPQLCSAAEYCEKSYLENEQKQMVLDNLKDYAVRALVNAVDHLGTVSYKLNEILEKQSSELSSMDLRVSCLDQKLRTCQTYTDKEGLRQQQLSSIIPRHHKHYVLPNSINKRVYMSPQSHKDPTQPIQTRPLLYPSVASAAKTLSWHLASATKPALRGSPRNIMSSEDDAKTGGKISDETKANKWNMISTQRSWVSTQSFGVTRLNHLEASKPLSLYRSFDNVTVKERVHQPRVQNKSVLSSFFAKQKKLKMTG